ncbi:MAG: ATP-dependent DNA ligase [Nanoarchaeota archaeon]|nr:ATP-dependent DNA ligase [Nanoarchaeota archaeon]
MKYEKLADLYNSLGSTTKRLEKTKILSDFLKELKNEDREVLYLLLGRVFPEYDQREIGISNQLAIKAISRSTGIGENEIVKEWKSKGDLGKVAEALVKAKKQSTLNRHELDTKKVLENLRKLPELEGRGTMDKKISLITELLSSASPEEALYVIRTVIGDLRIGIQESTIRDAMASAFFGDEAESASHIQGALDKTNDVGKVFEMVKKGKLKEIKEISLEVGKPIKVMLAQKVKTVAEGFEKVGRPCAIEYKYDGFRLLIHKKNNEVVLYTRRLENVTRQFPEVVKYVKEYIKGSSFIIDSEVVGFDRKTKIYRPFQEISQRIKRKYDIEKLQDELPVEINAFDILYYDGKTLLHEPFRERTVLLKKIVEDRKYKIKTAEQIITDDEKKAEKFFNQALADNQEGVMMKNLDSIYQPGSRVGFMLKIKPEEREMDLVIIGAEYGTGKRSGWMSSFVLACKKGSEFLEIGKVGTGIKEKLGSDTKGTSFAELTKMLKPLVEHEKGRDVEVKPEIVITVTYQEIQKSPHYKSGFALRFPRLKSLRPDRSPSDIESLSQVEKDYEKQGK